MSTVFDLRKEIVFDLKKESGMNVDAKAQVVLVLDYSGSMTNLYSDGTVQNVAERILPMGLAFDDNGEVDTYLFHNNVIELKEPITLHNYKGYIDHNTRNVRMGGTNYAPPLNAIYDRFKNTTNGGWFSKGKPTTMDYPVYVIFITDGENSDKYETESAIRKMSNEGFFIQFIGIGNESFRFLSKLDDLDGRKIDNANFMKINDINSISDADLYKGIMEEYPDWAKEAKQLNLIK